jgi:hypothetical protein
LILSYGRAAGWKRGEGTGEGMERRKGVKEGKGTADRYRSTLFSTRCS